MKTYESMKPSTVFWLGMIPEHWKCLKIGSLFSQRKVKVSDKDYAPLSVTKMGILPQLENAAKTNDGDNRKLVCAGDFVINSRSDRKGSCGISELDGSVSLINLVLTPRSEWNNRYAHYLLRSQPFSEEYYRYGRGIVADLWTTRFSEMKNILLPVPPREEQDQIVRFLDWKVSEINRLINIKHKEIARLEELKKAVVSRAVTYGDDGNEYPHIPLKRAFRILDNCRMPIAADMRSQNSEVLYDYYGASGVIDKIDGYTIDDDVLLIGEDGANLRLRNLPLIYQVHGKAWINNHAHILKPMIFMDYYYSFYMLETLDISVFITGAAQPKLTQEALRNLQIVAPPIKEQQKISAYLGIKCGEIDTVIENKHSQIKTLQEFKTRLISDVVTGKIDVRGIEIPEYEYTAEEADTDSEAEAEDLDEGGEEI